MIAELKKNIERLIGLLEQSDKEPQSQGCANPGARMRGSALLDFNATKKEHRDKLIESQLRSVIEGAAALSRISTIPENKNPVQEIQETCQGIDLNDPRSAIEDSRRILTLCTRLSDPTPRMPSLKVPPLPEAIKEDIHADAKELEKCMASGCYRSATILCGRILETALHRRYFDVTGQDILEKNPGIGLGNLIAKLVEKNVTFDPGLTQQIHLINQVRVFSVHKKQEAFNPSKGQAEAIVLYTMDALEKIFSKG